MAENKKSFVLYCDIIKTVEMLPNETAGELFKHLLSYVNDQDPITENMLVKLAFEPIKQQLKRDLKKWESIREKRSLAGKKSAAARKQKQQVLTSVESVEQKPTNSTVNDTVNVTVNVNTLYYNSERDFLADWKKAREAILKLPTNIQKLNSEESRIFQEVKDKYSIDYFRNAMQGLFVQKNMYVSNQIRPTHFFRDMNYVKYNDCFVNKTQLFEDKKQQQKL